DTLLHTDLGGGGDRVHRENRGDDEAGSPYQRSAFVLVDIQVAAVNQFFYACGRSTHPVGGEPDSTGFIPERDAHGVGAARRALVGHIELQGVVAGDRERRQWVGD